MKTKFLLVFAILLMSSLAPHAQQTSSIEKNSLSFNILGTGSYVGVSYERLVFDRAFLEVGLGVIGYGIGGTVYPLKKIEPKQINPFIGIKYTNHAIVDGVNKSATYLPVGVTFFRENKMNFSFDAGPSYFYYQSPGYKPTEEELKKYPYSDVGFWGNIKVGFRF